MKRRHKRFNSNLKEKAIEEAKTLLQEAETVFDSDKQLAKEYVRMARKICMKYKARVPSILKRKYCNHCHAFLKPPVNARIRLNDGKVVYYCLECKRFTRVAYK